MPDDIIKPPETPSSEARTLSDGPLLVYKKPDVQKSEAWTSIMAALGIIGASLSVTSTAGKIFVFGNLVITVGVYAYFHTSLPSMRPGWKTKAFIGAAISIVGSVALALSEANFPFLPAGVTKYAAIVSAAITAAGYTIYRYQTKKVEAQK